MKTLPMPKLSAEQVAVCNQLVGRRRDLSVTVGDEFFELRFAPAAASKTWPATTTFRFDIDGFPAWLCASWIGDFAPLSNLLGDANLVDLPPDVQPAVVASLLEPAFNQLAAACGTSVSIDQNGEPDRPGKAELKLAFSLLREDRPAVRGCIAFSPELTPAVLALAEQTPVVAHNDFSDVPAAAAAEVGRVSLSLRQMQTLAPFDVILLDDATFDDREPTARLALAPAMVCRATLNDSSLTVEEVEPWMPQQHLDDGSPVSSDDAPIELTCDVGQLRLPLSDWASLAPGTTHLFSRCPNNSLCIRAAGRIIGRAEPVRVGARVGARLITLSRPTL